MSIAEVLQDKAKNLMSSARDLNKLVVDKIEEATKLNIDSATYLSNAVVSQLRALSGVKDFDSAQKFTAGSISLSGDIVKKVLGNARVWMNINVEAKDSVPTILGGQEVVSKKKTVVKSDSE